MANNASAGYEHETMTLPALLITRPHEAAVRFAAGLSQDIRTRAKIVISPLLEIVPTDAQPDLAPYGGVIFTSSNAVELAPHGNQMAAYCVGHVTAQRAEAAGWEICAETETAEQLISQMEKISPAGPLLHLAGKYRRGEVAERLTALGIATDVLVLYDQRPVELSDQAQALLKGEGAVVVPLFSPRSAAQFLDQIAHLHNVIIVAMSDAVAQCCREMGARRILVAVSPTGQEMRRSLEKVMRDTSLA